MQKKWLLKAAPAPLETGLLTPGLHPYVSAILSARGISSPHDMEKFLHPALSGMLDPFMLKGMEGAVERLLRARLDSERICVYGDYDVDGITSTALLVTFLRKTGFDCFYYIPDRFREGYGLNPGAIESVIALGARVIISVDCGITSVEESELCKKKGAALIIVDHHQPGTALPDAESVINPLQPGCCYPFKHLAGVGLVFNLLAALRKRMREASLFRSDEPDLRDMLYLVAIGTIADIVPLTGQNRIFVYHGLRSLSTNVSPGIMALRKVAGINGKITSGAVGFRLAPRLNAGGRMESALPGVELLLSDDIRESDRLACELDIANAERQAIEARIYREAVEMLERSGKYPACRSILLASPEWHQGVVGIVASRMVERYYRPVILAAVDANGVARGSGRSIPGFHLLEGLAACGNFLGRYGGHKYAAGVSFNIEIIDELADAFESAVSRSLSEEELIPLLEIDMEASPDDLTDRLAIDLAGLAPFGAGNREPVFLMRKVNIVARRSFGENHLSLRLSKGGKIFPAVAFRMGERKVEGEIDVAFFPELNEWNGNSALQLRIIDFRPSAG